MGAQENVPIVGVKFSSGGGRSLNQSKTRMIYLQSRTDIVVEIVSELSAIIQRE